MQKAKDIIKGTDFSVDKEEATHITFSGRTDAGEDPSKEIIRQAKIVVPQLKAAGYRVSVESLDEFLVIEVKKESIGKEAFK
jgi:hypothetical protein